MKNTNTAPTEGKCNPYATNKAGYIKAPKNPGAADPKTVKIIGKGDLRGGKG